MLDRKKHLHAIGPLWSWVGHHRSRPACYTAVSIPYFYSAHPQRALPLKGGGSYSQLCLSIPRWSFKRAHSPTEREREEEREGGETAEIEIVWVVTELDRSQFIQPIIPQPIETSCPCYMFPLSTCWQTCNSHSYTQWNANLYNCGENAFYIL